MKNCYVELYDLNQKLSFDRSIYICLNFNSYLSFYFSKKFVRNIKYISDVSHPKVKTKQNLPLFFPIRKMLLFLSVTRKELRTRLVSD